MVLCKGSILFALLTAILTKSFDFSVAATGSCICTQLHWSRILAISNRYGFNPASRIVSWNNGSWVRGVHEATITRFKLCSFIVSTIFVCVSAEQV